LGWQLPAKPCEYMYGLGDSTLGREKVVDVFGMLCYVVILVFSCSFIASTVNIIYSAK